MVLPRKGPANQPLLSRNNTSQQASKVNKGKNAQFISDEEVDQFIEDVARSSSDFPEPQFSDDAVFSDGGSPRKSIKNAGKRKSSRKEAKTSRRRRKQPRSWLDFFARIFLLVFFIYSMSVCPTADKQKTPICRALSEYRRLVLEPYVITPFHNLLQHPSVSPYTTPVIERSVPIIARTQLEWNTRVVPTWHTVVVPQWNKRVVPQWEKHVIPQWNKHVSPQLQKAYAKVEPYQKLYQENFDKYITPNIARVQSVSRRAQPYVILTAAKTYDSYQFSKPYLARTMKELQRIPPFIYQYVLKPAGRARRQFVDPHVTLLLEKVKELSSSDAKKSVGSQLHPSSPPSTSAASSSDVESTVASEFEATPSQIATPSSNVRAEVSSPSTASLNTPAGAEVVSNVASSSELTGESESLIGQESNVVKASSQESSVPAEGIKRASVSNGAKKVADSVPVSGEESPIPSSAPFNVPKAHRPIQPVTPHGEDDDFDSFLEDLDLDPTSSLSGEAPLSTERELSEEEKAALEAEKKAIVVEKRRELQARHSKWEEQLIEMIARQTEVVKDAILSIRQDAAQDLAKNEAVRAALDTLHKEAEKALKGTSAYIGKLSSSGKPLDEQSRLWEKVITKVEAKFQERMEEAEVTVNTWYEESVVAKEFEATHTAGELIRSVADNAQADIGLDYAYLEDVTYLDWRRYHALLDKHAQWLDQTNALRNGSHPEAYENPVYDAFAEISSEVDDIRLGFESRMRQIKLDGARAFTTENSNEGATDSKEKVESPEVSILPIDDKKEGNAKSDVALGEVADAILGRSGAEVEQAFGRVDANARVSHEEL